MRSRRTYPTHGVDLRPSSARWAVTERHGGARPVWEAHPVWEALAWCRAQQLTVGLQSPVMSQKAPRDAHPCVTGRKGQQTQHSC